MFIWVYSRSGLGKIERSLHAGAGAVPVQGAVPEPDDDHGEPCPELSDGHNRRVGNTGPDDARRRVLPAARQPPETAVEVPVILHRSAATSMLTEGCSRTGWRGSSS